MAKACPLHTVTAAAVPARSLRPGDTVLNQVTQKTEVITHAKHFRDGTGLLRGDHGLPHSYGRGDLALAVGKRIL